MRLWRRKEKEVWVTDTTPVLKSSDLHYVLMLFGVWFGFVAAIHYADSPSLFAAVEYFNQTINPLLGFKRPPAPVESEALIVTADPTTELASVATLSPRGFHPVIAGRAQDALARVRESSLWKLVVIDATLPGAAELTRAVSKTIPPAYIVAVQAHRGAQAVSRPLLEHLNAPPRTTVAN